MTDRDGDAGRSADANLDRMLRRTDDDAGRSAYVAPPLRCGCLTHPKDAEDIVTAHRGSVTPLPSDAAAPLTFAGFSATNRARCESPDGFGHPVSGWSISDWMLAATGEFGEAANVAKKLNRVRDGIPGNTRTPDELLADLADEFADAVIYLDLAAQSQGIDLGAAIVSKFNRTSEKIGAPHRLAAPPSDAAAPCPKSPNGQHAGIISPTAGCSYCGSRTPEAEA